MENNDQRLDVKFAPNFQQPRKTYEKDILWSWKLFCDKTYGFKILGFSIWLAKSVPLKFCI